MPASLRTDSKRAEDVVVGPSSAEALVASEAAEASAAQLAPPKSSARSDDPLAPSARPQPQSSAERLAAAFEIAKRLDAAPTLQERIPIYQEAGRTLIYIAAARWPELMPMVNDDIEPRALLSADLS